MTTEPLVARSASLEQEVLEVLDSLGAEAEQRSELLVYLCASAACEPVVDLNLLPLDDEPFAAAWDQYLGNACDIGVVDALERGPLWQLAFPIEQGISGRHDYVAMSKRGIRPVESRVAGCKFVAPDAIRLLLHATPTGRIPVIVAEHRDDFETLVRAVLHRNEPVAIPRSQGACVVAGFNNWDRVAQYRREWNRGRDAEDAEWSHEFRRLAERKELYQDRFIVLSTGAYSAVRGEALGLSAEEWSRLSLIVRLEHECAHYFTRRAFGTMRNSIFDELIADYAGVVSACGCYRGDWALHFLGLESFPRYRAGARLENYRGKPPISDRSLRMLHSLIDRAVQTLERCDTCLGSGARTSELLTGFIIAMMREGITGLISDEGESRLRAACDALVAARHDSGANEALMSRSAS